MKEKTVFSQKSVRYQNERRVLWAEARAGKITWHSKGTSSNSQTVDSGEAWRPKEQHSGASTPDSLLDNLIC